MSSTPNASDTLSRLFWTPEELEQMVQWLEELSSQSRFKKGSRLTKKAALARQLSSKTAKQIFDKYCNIKISEVEGKEFYKAFDGTGDSGDDGEVTLTAM
jgi:hypothetical protein